MLGAAPLAAAIAFGFGAQGIAKDIVEKAYERRDEARERIQQGNSGQSTTDIGSTRSMTDRPEGSTTIEDEERPSARPLRREE